MLILVKPKPEDADRHPTFKRWMCETFSCRICFKHSERLHLIEYVELLGERSNDCCLRGHWLKYLRRL